ncbi:heparan-alpha-glucosaminide N-acetyltransferase domain-containing protein [Algoriphagus sp. CAU 1675]|uniref:acyltransferase family protein n=1 Tax=Algoriphagus sp. CAU 1675 TaxID=3032597 RepID=UPI0023D986F6|nr:heparan-alpha-glucosaminide N-acetyltransferase domain-containing protein [Algoriphagus sp. CAU 1675]MDF2159333.1 heparan-alpha-glucosaminide N-acetyltransferase domain-containing protein [Algoriphagus sp. CAU 1675]
MTQIPIQSGIGNRYLALDVLRGMTIAFMIIVNTPGSWSNLYAPLAHADWHGFTPTDLVFPTFLFVVGNAMSFAMKRLQEIPRNEFLKKVGKRTLLIFLIGWLLNAFPFYELNDAGEMSFINLTEIRFFGVLQRIALAYFFAALILYWGGIRTGWIFSAAALLAYWPIMYFFGDAGDPYGLAGNAAIKLDLLAIGADRMYMGEGIPFDPEGILSTLTSIVNVIGGYIAGKMIQKKGNTMKSVQTLLIFGIILIALSYAWDLVFPINKKIWTSPYVLLTVGWDLIILGGLIFITEIRNWKGWTYFFQAFGRNPLILYVCSGIVIRIFSMIPVGETTLKGAIYANLFTSWLGPKNASFLFAIFYMLLIWLIGLWMDKKKIYIKV